MKSKKQHSTDCAAENRPLPPTDAVALAVSTDLLWQATRAEAPDAFVGWAMSAIAAAVGADYAALATAADGRWATVAQWSAGILPAKSGRDGRAPVHESLPTSLLADVLDGEIARADAGWVAAPLAPRTTEGEVLVVHLASRRPHPRPLSRKRERGERGGPGGRRATRSGSASGPHRRAPPREPRATAPPLGGRSGNRQPVEPGPRGRAAAWSQMAEAATRLLGADRASIFLWDRPNHTLVGRPALGIPDGELRIPRRPRRGGRGDPHAASPAASTPPPSPQAVDRNVDAQLHYQTRTLLCVPLRGRSGELFGAFELINKLSGTFTKEDEEALGELAAHAAVALENAQDRRQLLAANRQIAQQAAEKVRLIGESPAIEALRSIVRRVADTDLAVLILGENGTGKEVVAQSIHYLSRRRDQPFIAVNCAAIPETLAESELFGHEKGAFTDAHEARAGKFELAAGGTLFLDEIGDLSLSGQAKLLRVIEEKTLVRVGGSTPIHTDARLLAATNQNLAEMVRAKRFREDLYFRLNVVALDLPPLRERGGDVLLLAEHFLGDFCKRARRKTPQLTAAARKRLLEHPWPGNIRELRNLMERLAYLSTEDRIDAEDLAFILSPRGQKPLVADLDQSLVDATTRFQTEYIRRQIEQSGGNMSLAATRLGLHRSNLYRKMRQLGMEAS